MQVPEAYGGGGQTSFAYNAILTEEIAASGRRPAALLLHLNSCCRTFSPTDRRAQERWCPGLASGELMTAIAMTEPGTGSDLAGITATRRRDGDTTSSTAPRPSSPAGVLADLVVVVARTARTRRTAAPGCACSSSRGHARLHRGRKLERSAWPQDTGELHFDDVRVPVANRLGEEGRGFG